MTITAMPMPTAANTFGIRDVWAVNAEEEYKKVRQIVQTYPYVAMVSYLPVHVESSEIFYFHPGSPNF
jgi:hypothetical protein